MDEYGAAVLEDPSNARIRSALGAALLVRGDEATAEPQLQEAVRLDPTDQTSWRNLGWALLLLRRDQKVRGRETLAGDDGHVGVDSGFHGGQIDRMVWLSMIAV